MTSSQNDLLFVPLGGSGEIGMNVNLYHLDGKWVMIDCGLGFAQDIPGIDMMTADISFIKKNKKNLLGIVLTHIHEDHIGAVQYLWEQLEVPVYATNFAANFLRTKLEEFNKQLESKNEFLKTWKDYTSHFLSWFRKTQNLKPDNKKTFHSNR